MYDHSFTASNLRKIFDDENRKGHDIEFKFFPEVRIITNEIKRVTGEIKVLLKSRNPHNEEHLTEKVSALNEEKKALKERKEIEISYQLDKISSDLSNRNYTIEVCQKIKKAEKKVYTIGSGVHSFFLLKQIQKNIRKQYKVKQSNRYDVISQLIRVLDDTFPKCIYRTDIKSFYESIPTKHLIEKIKSDSLLDPESRRVIGLILKSYNKLSESDLGLPRGIGISAYLSELYMRSFDTILRSRPDVLYFARYVDDIVVVFNQSPNLNPATLFSLVEGEINKMELFINAEKTSSICYPEQNTYKLDYLGYEIEKGASNSQVKVRLSEKKFNKYKSRIKSTFEAYTKTAKVCEKQARRVLRDRLKFITGNTRLLNNKKHTCVGVYFSNSLLNDYRQLIQLDEYLGNLVKTLSSMRLRNRLSKMTLTDGFKSKTYYKFTTVKLAKIVEIWSNHAA